MTTITGGAEGGGNNITQPALQQLAAASSSSHGATSVTFTLGDLVIKFAGSGFGDYNANGVPGSGTITSFQTTLDGVPQTHYTDFSIPFATLWADVTAADVTAFDAALFGGNDVFVSHDTSTTQEFDDVFSGFAGKDTFNMTSAAAGAFAELSGGDANDTFKFAGNFDATTDKLDGGAGIDQLILSGDYQTTPIAFVAANLTGVEIIDLAAGFNYNLTTDDGNVAAGTSLTVNGLNLSGTALTFNGSAETDGRFTIEGGAGNDVVTGGAGNDIFYRYVGGNHTAHGGGGNDLFVFKNAFTAQDSVDGGAGANVISLDGDYSAGLTLLASTMVNIGKIELAAGHSYNITTTDANVGAGKALTIAGNTLGTTDTLTFNGSAETDGKLVIDGGSGIDTLTGGAGDDHIEGGGNADHLNGGGGHDIFIYTREGDSLGSANGGPAGSGFDTITNFDFALDKLDMWFTVTAVDTEVTAGQLRQPFFDTDLTNTLTSGVLGAHSAVLFTPTTGDYDGQLFLIIDNNGVAGYQAGDTVIDITGAGHLTHLTTASFI